MLFQLCRDHARLHPHLVAVGLEDSPQEAAAVDDDTRTERAAGNARAGAARMHRDLAFSRPSHRGGHVVGRPRPHHSQRPDFAHAGVAGVEAAAGGTTEHLARHDAAKVFLDPLLLAIHRSPHGCVGSEWSCFVRATSCRCFSCVSRSNASNWWLPVAGSPCWLATPSPL